ncbi:MAG: hypothetical protein E6Q97_10665 [Desulfurellales bacterium]|nr:MAG: hypothetical protein E6Q97_10665 [Desulfurellales bacterium]
MWKTILEALKIVHVAPNDGATTTYALSAGTTDVNSVKVDASGFGRICFLCIFGDNADTGTFTGKIEGSANGTDGWTAVTGATTTFTAGASDTDNEMIAVECDVLPAYRYYRFVSDRGTANTVIAALLALLGKAQGQIPVTQSTAAGDFVQTPVNVIGA